MPSATLPVDTSNSYEEPADIPVVDYRQLHGGPEEREMALGQIDESFQSFGFLYLSQDSIPQEMVDEAFAWVRK